MNKFILLLVVISMSSTGNSDHEYEIAKAERSIEFYSGIEFSHDMAQSTADILADLYLLMHSPGKEMTIDSYQADGRYIFIVGDGKTLLDTGIELFVDPQTLTVGTDDWGTVKIEELIASRVKDLDEFIKLTSKSSRTP